MQCNEPHTKKNSFAADGTGTDTRTQTGGLFSAVNRGVNAFILFHVSLCFNLRMVVFNLLVVRVPVLRGLLVLSYSVVSMSITFTSGVCRARF